MAIHLSFRFLERKGKKHGWFSILQSTPESTQQDQHEEGVIWFLNHRVSTLTKEIENVRDAQKKKEKEAARLRDLRRSALASSRPSEQLASASTTTPALSTEKFAEEFKVSPEQMQMLVQENDALLKEYGEMREQISNTTASLNEIVRLQSTLQEHLIYQAAQIDRLFDEAQTTVETVRKANTHLNRAARTQSTSVRFFITFIILMSLFLLLIHIISD